MGCCELKVNDIKGMSEYDEIALGAKLRKNYETNYGEK